ncbi:MAG TPA: 3-hydroxyacyl-ACP dehydratase FabZ [Armatimonadota bacterium]
MTLDTEQIRQVLPHRYPFLLVDRILELEPGVRAIGLKNVTVNEPCFQGHWPHRAVMPAVLILEALAQVGGVMLLCMPEYKGLNAYFTGVDRARFRKPVLPGDTLHLSVELKKVRGIFGTVAAVATVEGQAVAEAQLMFALAPDGAGGSTVAAVPRPLEEAE